MIAIIIRAHEVAVECPIRRPCNFHVQILDCLHESFSLYCAISFHIITLIIPRIFLSHYQNLIQIIFPILMFLFCLFLLPISLGFSLATLLLCIALLLCSWVLIPIYMFDGYKIEAHDEEEDVCFSIAEDVSEGVRCPVSFEERGLVSLMNEEKRVERWV